jgi:hypothetical protein
MIRVRGPPGAAPPRDGALDGGEEDCAEGPSAGEPAASEFALRKSHLAAASFYALAAVAIPSIAKSPLLHLTLRDGIDLPLLRASVGFHLALLAGLAAGAAARFLPRCGGGPTAVPAALGTTGVRRLGIAIRVLHVCSAAWLVLSVLWVFRSPVLRLVRPNFFFRPGHVVLRAGHAAGAPGSGTRLLAADRPAAVAVEGALPPAHSAGAGPGPSNHHRPRFAIAVVADGLPPARAAALLARMKSYTDRHGYALVEGVSYYGGRPWQDWEPALDPTASRFTAVHKTFPVWCKIPLLWNLSHAYDFVAWFDLDAVITNPAVSLEDVMGLVGGEWPGAPPPPPAPPPHGAAAPPPPWADERPQLWIADDFHHRGPGLAGTVHAGVFVMRGSAWTRALLATILGDGDGGQHMFAEQFLLDEAIFNTAGRPRYAPLGAASRTVLMPFHALDSTPNSFFWHERWLHGDFVAHNAGDKWKVERLGALLAYLAGETWAMPLWTYVW